MKYFKCVPFTHKAKNVGEFRTQLKEHHFTELAKSARNSLLNLLNYNFWQNIIIFLHADILYTKVSHLKVSLRLFQFLIFCSNYAICTERTVS
jgi:hypothetical protein